MCRSSCIHCLTQQRLLRRPSISRQLTSPEMFRRLILLSGPVGAGKTTLAELLCKRYQIELVRTRSLLLQMTRADDERDQLQRAGERLDTRTKGRWLAEALAKLAEQYKDNVEILVDAVRINRQIEEIRATFGVPVLHVH